jgi:arsenate reductase-like glutaredoxin family protein
MSSDHVLEELLIKCRDFIDNEDIVYKLCVDYSSKNKTKKWLVVMEKIKDSSENTITNEDRKSVKDIDYAKHHANIFKVIKIININKPKLEKKHILVDEYPEKSKDITNVRTVYKVGKKVKQLYYNSQTKLLCPDRISYFRTLLPAYYDRCSGYESICPKCYCCDYDCDFSWKLQYTGYWLGSHTNGQKFFEGKYIKGLKEGYWVIFYKNGEKKSDGNYKNNKEDGKWTSYNDDGTKDHEWTYSDGVLNGEYVGYGRDNKIYSKGSYKDDKREGVLITYHENGKKYLVETFRDGDQVGIGYEYDENEKLINQIDYDNRCY